MSSPSQVVTEFLALWAEPGGPDDAVRRYFTDESVWDNVGLARTTGQEEALALNAQFGAKFGMATIGIENLAIAETGNKVLTERIDTLIDGEGRVIGSFPCMGIFEVEGHKITLWRDYFDTANALQPA
ncbi:MAG: nuclear transport factor 2 family protein [Novosphingobium sp.]|nr:nuclear transport factor 2 family protein [Novosphingobium sp.]